MNILKVLHSDRGDIEIQNEVLAMVGFENVEFAMVLIKNRTVIREATVDWAGAQGMTSSLMAMLHQGGREFGKQKIFTRTEKKKQAQLKKKLKKFRKRSLNVQDTNSTLDNMPSSYGPNTTRPALPKHSRKHYDLYGENNDMKSIGTAEEVYIPINRKKLAEKLGRKRINILDTFPEVAQQAFIPFGIESLNPMQTVCMEPAFRSDDNLLICAPTGAGKTVVAMMTVLREVLRNFKDGKLKSAKEFKIVYVAPMKALAAEVVRKFSQRLGALGIVVKELTGDMQLTRTEVEQTHMLVTTPEKYDVITRKPNEISQILKLMIIDEVHLLHDERGCVIDALVARTRRLCQSLQTSTRIVGLSATLPNVNDVATFLGVPKTGLMVFDGTYRPVPLEQTFIGVTDTNNMLMKKLQNQVCLKKVEASIREGYQVMVFVHSRKETRSTAQYLKEHLELEKFSNLIEMQTKEPLYHRTMKSRLNEQSLRDLLPRGYGMHHA